METKFHLLPVGQHFEWEGKRYVKTTPLIANQLPDGGQRFIPRSTMVKLSAAELTANSSQDGTGHAIDWETLHALLDKHQQRCLSLTSSQELREGLEQSYRALLEELKLRT